MTLDHIPDKRLITGTSGSGKTTFWLSCVRGSSADYKFIFDHEGEMALRLNTTPARNIPELNEQTRHGVCLFDPSTLYPGQLPRAFDFFCDYVFTVSQCLKGKKLLCCDELQKLVGTNVCSQELAAVLDTGRRYRLDFYCIAQSPNLIHTRIRNQLTKVVTFRQSDERAINFLEQCGFEPEIIRGLPPGEWQSRDLNTGLTTNGRVFQAVNKTPKEEKTCGQCPLPVKKSSSPKKSKPGQRQPTI